MIRKETILRALAALSLGATLACGTTAITDPGRHSPRVGASDRIERQPSFVFATIEAAAIDALAHAHFSAKLEERNRHGEEGAIPVAELPRRWEEYRVQTADQD